MAQFVKAYNDDPFVGHLSTPVSDSDFTRAFIGNLPAYRKGLSPLLRGLEVGMAHGYFIVGPWTKLGPLRDSDLAAFGGLVSAMGLIIIATMALSAHGLARFQNDDSGSSSELQSAQGWSKFSGGFFIGAMGGAFCAYLLLANIGTIDDILKGVVNY
ncbi:MAG: photosystem I reaction center protein subunit XI [Alkalinema sp. CACIAM 70d]|uniref:photosystem I reaction center protein subunit XI n=1 Tax=Alkalinema sp. FACHB-956 TaxID=2692768 RepID=UPI000B75B42C|nr:photosystem I reaction center protein subunit XI [Alkalinema sp. FACHB-956]MBD2326908.1 photosystem I reaction center protein subunit XI [Alkalinema sp. FACHB-956]OUC14939.1 MAG: photosystem I reaction center protein subunit XI [Alkalinema sp. CACIAM 70d]